MMDKALTLSARSIDEIKTHPILKIFYTTYIFQAGQPEYVRKEFSEVMGLEVQEFDGIVNSRNSAKAMT
jgi:5,5'-dehydrodivanillate O-demethylase